MSNNIILLLQIVIIKELNIFTIAEPYNSR